MMVGARLEVGELAIDPVAELIGEESMGAAFRYVVRGAIPLPLPRPSALLGRDATILLADAFARRTIRGVVAEVRTSTTDEGHGAIELVVAPAIHRLAVGRASRSFQDRSAIDVAVELLAPTGAPRLALRRTYGPVPYRVQRDEDDWSFVVRTLAGEGVTFWFDHEDGSRLVIGDDTPSADDIEGVPVLPHHASGLDVGLEAVVDVARRGAVTTGSVARRSFSFRNPALALDTRGGGGPYEAYDAPGGGPDDPARLERLARDGLDALRAAAGGIDGEATSIRLVPGRAFSIAATGALGEEPPWIAARWLVTGTTVRLSGSRHAFRTRFSAVPIDVPVRPAPPSPRPGPRAAAAPARGACGGLAWAVVTARASDEVMPDADARVRAKMLWDRGGARDERAGTWVRVAQRFTTGSMLFPRAGWIVAIANEEGSVDAPSALGRIHDGEHRPTYPLPEHQTRVVLKTATSPGGGSHNELHFEDAKGREEVRWNASHDMRVIVEGDASETIERDARQEVGAAETIVTGASFADQVGADQTTAIGARQSTSVGGDRAEAIGGDDAQTVGASRTLQVGTTSSLGVSGSRSCSVGAAMIDVSLGQIAITARHARLAVGGALVRLGAQTYSETAALASAEVVGGAKVVLAGVNRVVGVDERFVETVGGAVLVDAGKRYVDTATSSARWSAGGALVATAGEEITLEAHTSIELRCGASVIVIDGEEIRIESLTLRLDGAQLEAITGVIAHNG